MTVKKTGFSMYFCEVCVFTSTVTCEAKSNLTTNEKAIFQLLLTQFLINLTCIAIMSAYAFRE